MASTSGVVELVLSGDTVESLSVEFSPNITADMATLLDLACIIDPSVAISNILLIVVDFFLQ